MPQWRAAASLPGPRGPGPCLPSVQPPSPCLADAGGGQERPAWTQCPAVQAVLRMGFGRGQVQGLLQRKYRQVVPTGVSTSQLVADLLQEEDGGRAAGAGGTSTCLDTAHLSLLIASGHSLPSPPPGAQPTASRATA